MKEDNSTTPGRVARLEAEIARQSRQIADKEKECQQLMKKVVQLTNYEEESMPEVWTYQLTQHKQCILNTDNEVKLVESYNSTEVGILVADALFEESAEDIKEVQKKLFENKLKRMKDFAHVAEKQNLFQLAEKFDIHFIWMSRLTDVGGRDKLNWKVPKFVWNDETKTFGGATTMWPEFLRQVITNLSARHPDVTEASLCRMALGQGGTSGVIDSNIFQYLTQNTSDDAQRVVTGVMEPHLRGVRALLRLTMVYGSLTLNTRVAADAELMEIALRNEDGPTSFLQQLYRQALTMETLQVTPWEKVAMLVFNSLSEDRDSAIRLRLQDLDYSRSSDKVWADISKLVRKSSIGTSLSNYAGTVRQKEDKSKKEKTKKDKTKKESSTGSRLVKVRIGLDTLAMDHLGPMNITSTSRGKLNESVKLLGVTGETSELTDQATLTAQLGDNTMDFGPLLLGASVKQPLWSISKAFKQGVVSDFHLRENGKHSMTLKSNKSTKVVELEMTEKGVFIELECQSNKGTKQ